MTKLIKLYGERNTNTNYMSKLISLNLDALEIPGVVPNFIMKMQNILPGNEMVRDTYFDFFYSRNLGWKHSRAKNAEQLKKYKLAESITAFITITKNPYSWLLSLHRRPYNEVSNENMSFEDFIQQPWKTNRRDNVKVPISNPIELWNIKNRSYLDLDEQKRLNITTEDILEDPAKIIQTISDRFSIPKKSTEFRNYDSSTKAKDKEKDTSFYRDYYLSEKWREGLSKKSIRLINESLDEGLMAHFNYQLLA